jgi:hypothetical protein
MKKFIALILVSFVGLSFVGVKSSEAQVPYGARCCDAYGLARCGLVNPVPVGNPCFCPGQGWGYTCI